MSIFRNRMTTPLIVGLGVLILDFITKALVASFIPLMRMSSFWYPYGGIGVFKDFLGIEFSIVHTVNKGAAWGLLADYQEALLWFRIALILLLLGYVIFFQSARPLAIPLSLVIAGAIGNVIDYFVYGQVVDLFRFVLWGYDFPVFNVADSAIFIGICWLGILTLFTHKHSSQPKKNR